MSARRCRNVSAFLLGAVLMCWYWMARALAALRIADAELKRVRAARPTMPPYADVALCGKCGSTLRKAYYGALWRHDSGSTACDWPTWSNPATGGAAFAEPVPFPAPNTGPWSWGRDVKGPT